MNVYVIPCYGWMVAANEYFQARDRHKAACRSHKAAVVAGRDSSVEFQATVTAYNETWERLHNTEVGFLSTIGGLVALAFVIGLVFWGCRLNGRCASNADMGFESSSPSFYERDN